MMSVHTMRKTMLMQDDICGDVDECPYDAENDADLDGICGDVDDCPYDAENDADLDGICGDVDECPYDAENDADEDAICGDVDTCPYDFDNDIDGDMICDCTLEYLENCPEEFDACPIDVNDDSDGDGSCDSEDLCQGFDDNLDSDLDLVPDDCDDCPYDNLNLDENNDGICDIQGPEPKINYPYSGESFASNHSFIIEYDVSRPELVDNIKAYWLNEDGEWIFLNESSEINNTIEVTINSINSSIYKNASIKLIANAFNLDFESNQVDDLIIINENQNISLDPGWHMIGVPLNLYDNFSEELFAASSLGEWVMFNEVGDFSNINLDFLKDII